MEWSEVFQMPQWTWDFHAVHKAHQRPTVFT